MEIYEKINAILKQKKIKKRELAHILMRNNYHLKSTGDIPSEKAIYAYLSGKNSLRVELIPPIAEALNVSVCELFPDDESDRMLFLKYVLSTASAQEFRLIRHHVFEAQKDDPVPPNNHMSVLYKEVRELLPYAPEVFLKKLIDILESYKDVTRHGVDAMRR
jgi:transcriptional regulator with XRE-family HTH domain